MRAGRLNSGPGRRRRWGQASRDSRSDPGRRLECSSLGPCSQRAHLENRRDNQDREGKALLTWMAWGKRVSIFILVLSSGAHRWLLTSTKFIKATADILSWHESVNCFKVCHLLWTSKVLGWLIRPRCSLLAPECLGRYIVSTTLYNWSTVYFKACCLTISSAPTFAYSSDVLCMIDLFCLFALSPRSHIKANISVLHKKRYTHEPKLKDYLYEAFTSAYLPRYPCHLSRAFQSLHRIPGLSILTGRCSARRSDRGRTSRCCCTARGIRLSTYHVRVKQPSK